jgi:hypothetical protein
VIGQERSPRLGGRTNAPLEQSRHGSLRHLDAQFAQLAVNSRSSPQRICSTHLVHECANGCISAGAARADPLRAVRPAAAEPFAVPPQDRLWLNDHQGGAPFPPRFGEHDPKEAISWAELRAFTGTRQRRQLLSKREVLERPPRGGRGTAVRGIGGVRQALSACVILSRIQRQNQPTGPPTAFWRSTGSRRGRDRCNTFN